MFDVNNIVEQNAKKFELEVHEMMTKLGTARIPKNLKKAVSAEYDEWVNCKLYQKGTRPL